MARDFSFFDGSYDAVLIKLVGVGRKRVVLSGFCFLFIVFVGSFFSKSSLPIISVPCFSPVPCSCLFVFFSFALLRVVSLIGFLRFCVLLGSSVFLLSSFGDCF